MTSQPSGSGDGVLSRAPPTLIPQLGARLLGARRDAVAHLQLDRQAGVAAPQRGRALALHGRDHELALLALVLGELDRGRPRARAGAAGSPGRHDCTLPRIMTLLGSAGTDSSTMTSSPTVSGVVVGQNSAAKPESFANSARNSSVVR